MLRLLRILFLMTAGLVLGLPAEPTACWMPAAPGIEADPSLHWGRLPNGLRYVLKRQPHPPGATSLRMVVFAGFLHERETERGHAHFVEHMGFNGTTRFRGESLGTELEQAGIRFGPELSAFTWPSHTIYQLDLPASDDAKLDLGVTVLREWASEIRFDRKQVKRERGVILAEKEARGRASARLTIHRLSQLYPDSILSTRNGQPSDEQIQSTDRDDLLAFYQRWYRPDNTVIVAVGDFEPAALGARLEQAFADWARPDTPLPRIDLGRIANHAHTRANITHNPEVSGILADLTLVRPRTRADSRDIRRKNIAASLAISALQRRFTAIARAQPGTFGRLGVSLSAPTPFASELTFYGSERPDAWPHLSSTLIDEYRRYRIHAFLPGELEVARRHLRRAAEFSVRAQTTRPASSLADALAQEIIWGVVPTSPEFDRDLTLATLAELDEEACNEALKPFFADGFPFLLLATSEAKELGDDRVAEFLNGTLRHVVTPPVVPEIPEFPYTDFGPAGEIVQRSHDAALDVHMVEFANGVKLNLKRTTFEEDTVYLTARIDSGGRLAQPESSLGIDRIAEGALLEGGLGKLDPEQLQSALAGHFAALNFHVGEDTFTFRGSADSQEVELLLQLFTAYLTDPEVRPEAVAMAKQNYQNWIGEAFRDPRTALSIRGTWDFFNEDNRFGIFPPQHIQALDPIAVRAWLLAGMNEAPIEVGLVGDFDVEATIAFAAATLGTLPPREAPRFQVPARLRRTPVVRLLQVQTSEPQAAVMFAWHVGGLGEVRRRRTLEILGWVLRNELLSEVREKLGITYDPHAGYWASEAVRGEGFLTASFTVNNSDLERALREVRKLASRLAKRGLPRGALERAREPLLQSADAQLEGNRYWLNYVVSAAQTDPDALASPRTRKSDLATITADEVEALAREVIDLDRIILLVSGL